MTSASSIEFRGHWDKLLKLLIHANLLLHNHDKQILAFLLLSANGKMAC